MSSIENVKALLNLGKGDVRIVGIYGMRGIGKTEIAKTVYNHICHGFEGSSFLLDIEVITEKFNGLVQLQEQLLRDILKKDITIDHSAKGISMIKKRLHRKKVLVVLDDLDHLEKLDNLLGDFRCFGLGSRFVITTADERLLTQVGVDDRYKVGSLNKLHSLELFCQHAFDLSHPRLGYEKLSINAVEYTGGLPLALKVLGSFLKGMTNTERKCELEKLQKKPHGKIQQVLRRSFDSLDDFTKDMFLDIACFFVSMDKEYVIKIFKGCGFSPNSGITFLEQRSLVMSDYKNQLKMHSLIQQMGRQIICEKALNLPKKYSRLWSQKIALSVLRKHVMLCNLKILNLSYSEDLIKSPNVLGAPLLDIVELEKLLSPVFFQRKSSKSVVRFHTIFQQSGDIPKWFGLQAAGSSISFHVPSLLEGKVGGLLVCASYHETSYAPIATLTYGPLLIVSVHNKSRGVYKVLFTDARRRLFFAARCVVHKIPVITKLVGGHKRYFVPEISYIPPRLLRSCYVHCPKEIGKEMEIGTGDEVEVAIEFHPDIKVYKCGIHLLVDETNVTQEHEFDMGSESYAPPDDNILECIATTSHNITRSDTATEDGVFEDDVAAVDEVA